MQPVMEGRVRPASTPVRTSSANLCTWYDWGVDKAYVRALYRLMSYNEPIDAKFSEAVQLSVSHL